MWYPYLTSIIDHAQSFSGVGGALSALLGLGSAAQVAPPRDASTSSSAPAPAPQSVSADLDFLVQALSLDPTNEASLDRIRAAEVAFRATLTPAQQGMFDRFDLVQSTCMPGGKAWMRRSHAVAIHDAIRMKQAAAAAATAAATATVETHPAIQASAGGASLPQ